MRTLINRLSVTHLLVFLLLTTGLLLWGQHLAITTLLTSHSASSLQQARLLAKISPSGQALADAGPGQHAALFERSGALLTPLDDAAARQRLQALLDELGNAPQHQVLVRPALWQLLLPETLPLRIDTLVSVAATGQAGKALVLGLETDLTQDYQSLRISALAATLGALLALLILQGIVMRRLRSAFSHWEREQSSRSAAANRVQHQATHDPLTGLPNRTLLNERLEQALHQAKRGQHSVVVMLLDLDGFKAVNDTLGHQAGDRLLQVLGKRLSDCIREGDTLARLGGDEFMVLLPLFDSRYQESVTDVARRMLDSIVVPVKLKDQEARLGCSIGISRYPADGKTSQQLIQQADSAMYRAKGRGRNNVELAQPNSPIAGSSATSLKEQLSAAITQNQLQLLYQPLFEGSGGRVAALEAQLHWQHPQLGLLTPQRLLPMAAFDDQAQHLQSWMLRSAGSQLRSWRRMGLPLARVSMQLLVRPEQIPALAGSLKRIFADLQLPLDALELVLDPQAFSHDLEAAQARLQPLRELGVRLCLDRSAGGASLTTLSSLPLDSLIIEAPVCAAIRKGEHAATLAVTLLALARQLKLEVVARGMETEPQKALLQARGCAYLQSDLLSPALEIDAATSLLRARSAAGAGDTKSAAAPLQSQPS